MSAVLALANVGAAGCACASAAQRRSLKARPSPRPPAAAGLRPAPFASARRPTRCHVASPEQPAVPAASEEESVGLAPEDDVEVPGTYFDALNPQTKLGKAVRAAVEELNHLNSLEMDTLRQADELLKKLGLKSSIMQAPAAAAGAAEAEAAAEEEEEEGEGEGAAQ